MTEYVTADEMRKALLGLEHTNKVITDPNQVYKVTLAVPNVLLGQSNGGNSSGFSFGVSQLDIGSNDYAQDAYIDVLDIALFNNKIDQSTYNRLIQYNGVQRPDLHSTLSATYAADKVILTGVFSQSFAKPIIDSYNNAYINDTLSPTINGFITDMNQLWGAGTIFDPSHPDFSKAVSALITIKNRKGNLIDAEDYFSVADPDTIAHMQHVYNTALVQDAHWDKVLIGAKLMSGDNCFPSGTLINMWDGSKKSIEEIKIGDSVLSFDSEGNLKPGRVSKVFNNIAESFLKLEFSGSKKPVYVTAGHEFYTVQGDFKPIGQMVQSGVAEIVLKDGSIEKVSVIHINYSKETAHLFEEIQQIYTFAGNLALKPQQEFGWKTYNFEVDGFHTYVADDIMVHNLSVIATGEDYQNNMIIELLEEWGIIDEVNANLTLVSNNEGKVIGVLLKEDTSAEIDNTTYIIKEVINSISDAAGAVAKFINDQVSEAIEWFTNDGAGAIQLDVANWLAGNLGDLIDGNISTDQAFIDLAEYIGTQRITGFITNQIANVTQAKAVLADAFLDSGAGSASWLHADSVYTALSRMAIDFAVGSEGWDSEQYVKSGLTTIASVIAYNYGADFFKSAGLNAGGAAAAATTIVAGLLDSSDYGQTEWVMLGVQAGIAYGSAVAGAAIAESILGAAATTANPAVLAAAAVIAAVIAITGGKIVQGIYKGQVFYEGEFGDPSLVLNSVYQVQNIVVNGATVPALVAVNSLGSTVIASGTGIGYVIGNGGSDVLVGDDNVQTITGNGGADYLEAKGGNDNLLGGDGNDHLNGGDGDDILQGDAGDDIIFGEDGNDIVIAGTGDDFVQLGSGDDIAAGGDGKDYIIAGGGDDAISGDAGDDTIDGGYGDDSISGGTGNDLILGNLGNDAINGDDGNDTVFGDDGNDTIYGGNASDFIDGGAGSDILNGDNGNDLIFAGEDADFADGGLGDDNILGGNGDDALLGGMDNDYINGEDGDDILEGGFGNDILVGGKGANTMDGADGDDVFVISADVDEEDNIITDSEGSDTILLSWLTQANSTTGLQLLQEGDDLKISYNGRVLTTITNQFISGNEIEKIELQSGKYIDLSAVTYDGGTGIGTFSVGTLSSGSVASDVASRETDIEQNLQAKEFYWNDTFFSKLSQIAYDEQLGDQNAYTYYNGSQVESFFRNRGKFGGKYTVYKLDVAGNMNGTDMQSGISVLSGGYNPANYDHVYTGIQKVTTHLTSSYNTLNHVYGGDLFFYDTHSYDVTVYDYWQGSTLLFSTQVYGTAVYPQGDAPLYQTTTKDILGNSTDEASLLFEVDSVGHATFYDAAARHSMGTTTTVDVGYKLVSTGDDQLVGGYWDETIDGKSGDDVLIANSGNDTVIGGDGNDWLFGGDGNDTVTGGNGSDVLFGGDGNDTLNGNAGDDAIMGSTGNDTITGDTGNDWIDGGAGDDNIDGGNDNDIIYGNDGNDTINGGSGADILHGDDGDDTLEGGDGDDIIYGGLGNDYINGGNGNDILDGGGGAGTLDGGDGDDILSFRSATSGMTIDVSQVLNPAGSSTGDILVSIEGVGGTNYNDIITGFSSQRSIIWGFYGNDNITGGSANDTIFAGGDNDTVTGNAGDDIIHGESGTDTLYGNDGNDQLNGGSENDYLYGGNNDDSLNGGLGSDVLDGGTGSDTAYYNYSSAGVNINLQTGAVSGGDAAGDTFISIERLWGSSYNDVLTGFTNQANYIWGDLGNDQINGGNLNDELHGNAGNDAIYGNDGNDWLTGNEGNDTIYGGNGNDTMEGNDGADVFFGGAGNDYMDGGDLNDRVNYSASALAITVNMLTNVSTGGDAAGDTFISVEEVIGTNYNDSITVGDINNYVEGGSGNDNINGSGGYDYLLGQAGNDIINGGDDDDTIEGGAGADNIDGGNGTDTISFSNSTTAVSVNILTNTYSGGDAAGDSITSIENIGGSNYNDTLTGNSGNNSLWGAGGYDTLNGNDGDDWIEGGAGADTINGGNGTDTLSYVLATSGVYVDITTNNNLYGDAQGDVISNMENIIGSSYNDTLTGNSGNNIISSGDGDDTINGWQGADTIDGGNGFDIASYWPSTAAVNINLLTNVVSGGDAQGDIISNFEGVIGSNYNDILTGSSGINSLWGKDGDDAIYGNAGNDSLYGENGGDTIVGGEGADLIDGGAGTDTASYYWSSSAVTINMLTNVNAGGEAAGDTFTNIENISASQFNDTITGNSGNNSIWGNDGDDAITGGAGADTIDGGSGVDQLAYGNSSAAVNINLATNTVSGGDAQGDVISNIENVWGSNYNDTLTGSSGNNSLWGAGGYDTLNGNDGDDWIEGGAGADTINGGNGTDTLSYVLATSGVYVDITTNNNLYGDAQGDVISNMENIIGSSYNDTLTGNAGNNTISSGDGDDTINGWQGADTIDGGNGFDIASYWPSTAAVNINLLTNVVSGGDAQGDIISNFEGVIGSNYNDILTGSSGVNSLWGKDGDDILEGGSGADNLDGGNGTDTLSYVLATSGVYVDITTNNNLYGDAQGDVISNMENIIGSSYNDTLTGNSGNNIISSGDGDDAINGWQGADTIDGGNGFDIASYWPSTAAVNINLSNNVVSGGDAQGDIISNFEGVIGSNYNDILTGSSGVNSLWGKDGDDAIYGNAGNDSLYGENGGDTIIGGEGADLIDGGSGTDTASYYWAISAITINLSTGINTGSEAAGDTLTNIENISASQFNDTITGNSANNSIWGNDGNDTINGWQGADTIDGGNGFDIASYWPSTAAVNINLLTNVVSGGDAQGDIISNFEGVIGSNYNDILTGSSGVNSLWGKDGDDAIYGNAGNDSLYGENGGDTIVGGDGADLIDGGSGTDTASYYWATSAITINLSTGINTGSEAAGDTLTNIENISASQFNDTITGNSANNSIWGNDGDDILDGGAGADYLDGGNGTDTITYVNSVAGIYAVLGNTTGNTGGDAEGDSLLNIENITGSAYNDLLGGNSGNNTILAGAGDDIITGAAGADTIDGGSGVDQIAYGNSTVAVNINLATNVVSGGDAQGDIISNIENVVGSGYNDTITGSSGNNSLWGLAGNDTLSSGDGNDTLEGGAGADSMNGGNGFDIVSYLSAISGLTASLQGPGPGSPTNTGDAVGDTYSSIEGLAGSNYNDILNGFTGAATSIWGYDGNDTINGGSAIDTIYGGNGNDTIVSLAGNDILYGDDGDDIINGGAGADTINGGAGTDRVEYTTSTSAVTVNLITNVNTGGDAASDSLTSIESIAGSSYNDTITGTTGDNTLWGMSGNDTINGNDGNDLLYGGSGSDTIDGGTGSDTARYSSSTSAVTVNLTTNVNTGGEAQGDSLTNIENIFGSTYNDTLTGNSSANIITGGAGADTIDGGGAFDRVEYTGSTSAVTVNLTTNVNTGGEAQGDSLSNIEDVAGSSYNDTITGTSGNNTLWGMIGNDTLNGNDGNDLLYGGSGSDTIDGGNGTDTTSYSSSTSAVTVNLTTNVNTGGDAAGDSITNIENITGSNYNDTLTGNSADNFIFGGAGLDILTGWSGADTFSFGLLTESTTAGRDVITDFTHGIDHLKVSGLGFDDIEDFSITHSGGDTFVTDLNSDFSIQLLGNFTLDNSDFIFS